MDKEFVLIEKDVLEKLIETVNELQERLDDIDHYTKLSADMIGAVAEKLGVA